MNCPKCGNVLNESENDRYVCDNCGTSFKRKTKTSSSSYSSVGSENKMKDVSFSFEDDDANERSMYKNIGSKIKTLTAVMTYVAIAFAIVFGTLTIAGDLAACKEAGEKMSAVKWFVDILIYFIIIPLAIWAGSFFAYGFGDLIEKNKKNAKNSELMVKLLSEINAREERKENGNK